MSRTARAGWGRRAAGTPARAETSEHLLSNWVKWDEGGWERGKKTKPKTTAFKQLLFTICTEPGGQSIPVQRPPRGRVRHGHTHNRDRWPPLPVLPWPGSGERVGAARLLQGRGRASARGEPLRGWGSRGPESPCPRALGSSRERGSASSRAWCPQPRHGAGGGNWHDPKCLWQSLSVLVPRRALPAAWGSRFKSRRWMRRAAAALSPPAPSGTRCPRVRGALAGVVGGRVTAQETNLKASGRSGPCKALGRNAGSRLSDVRSPQLCARLPPATPSPSHPGGHRGQRPPRWGQEQPPPPPTHCSGRRPHAATELRVLSGVG